MEDETSSKQIWQDITPVHEDEGLAPIVRISCSPEDADTMDLFYAVLKSGELSERVLALTEEMLLQSFMDKEAEFLDEMLMYNPKNYQLWNYRRRFAFHRGAQHADEEFAYVNKCLDGDAKNYHAWAHRVAVAERYGLWEQELDDLSRLLEEDPRNNSAWNHRFMAVKHMANGGNAEEIFQREVSYTRSMILKAPHNESSWNYLRGLCTSLGLTHKMPLEPALPSLCLEVLQQKSSCSLALGFLADIYTEQSRLSKAVKDQGRAAAAAALGSQCLELLQVTDPMRQSFWRQRRLDLASLCSHSA